MATERKEKYRTQTSTSIDKLLLATLEELAKEQRCNKSRLYDEALKLLFKEYGKEIKKETEL
ncbi:ribbon-helix-helix domain-containing protein [Zhenhengia yiwuensis]|uniref:Ribbon-helix-helix domain-containing protein n=1 Tax=Zhenhengia yiwuensis TaxID=2763666 RepID=A0A926EID7_9FIRM|nr:ribbon-helix-helix domain-containing protein [Zhenhengia yiwuensis]MBC8579120.1 ribbon-helix-helix domain-containing protein [Zhenhengia yiwuensis]